MGNETDKKFTWVIKVFSFLNTEKIYSDDFVVGGCKWRLLAYPKGNTKVGYVSLFLGVSESISLPTGWSRHAKFTFTLVNQILEEKSLRKGEIREAFVRKSPRNCIIKVKYKEPDYEVSSHPDSTPIASANITKDDMADAYATLGFVTNAGFRLNWLLKKTDEVSEKKDQEEASETVMETLEEELNGLKHKCSDVEAPL